MINQVQAVPEGCNYSRCTAECDCYYAQWANWSPDQLAALAARIGFEKPFVWLNEEFRKALDLQETLHAIDMAAESAPTSALRFQIFAIINRHAERAGNPVRELAEPPEDGAPIPYDRAEEIGRILHREILAATEKRMPDAGDFIWADIVQTILRHARA